MFTRYRAMRSEDEPTWREKLDDWRAAPPWVVERPAWTRRFSVPLALTSVGAALVALAAMYALIAPASLPRALPGHYAPAPTTTTTISPAEYKKRLASVSHLTSAQSKQFSEFLAQSAAANAANAANRPAPSRRLTDAGICLVGALALFAWAWSRSRTRAVLLDGR
jgi:hypothetical protein